MGPFKNYVAILDRDRNGGVLNIPFKNPGYAHLFLKQMLKSFSHLKIDFSMICGIYWDDSFFAMHFFRGQNVLNIFLCKITQSRQED